MRNIYFHSILIIFFLIRCTAWKTTYGITNSYIDNPLIYGFNKVIDFHSISQGDIEEATTITLMEADKILIEITSVVQLKRTFENTLLKLDDLYNTVSKVWNIIELLSSTHPLTIIREEADENDLRIQNYMIDVSINEDLYQAILSYSNLQDAQTLTGGRKHFLQSELRDFKRSGMELKVKQRDKLKTIQTRLSQLGINFSNNITSNSDTLFINEDMTEGLPENYKNQRIQSDGNYAIDLSYPSFDPFMMYSVSDSLRKLLRFKYLNIAAPDNINILNKIIRNRKELSELLGYPSYAAYTIEESMAKTTTAVWEFENSLRKSIEKKAT